MMRYFLPYLVFIFVIFCSFPTQSTKKPLQITVTPLPQKNKALHTPSISITSKTLEETQQTYAREALDQAPGVTSLATGTEGSTSSIKFRGANDGHTLVLIDGIPVNNPAVTTNFFDFGVYRNSDVEKITLLPGSQSLLYGSNAIGGVVLIDTLSGEEERSTGITQEAGAYHLVRTKAHTAGQVDRLRYRFMGDFYRIGEGAIWNRQQQVRQSDDFHDRTGSAKFNLQATPCLNVIGYVTATQNQVKNNNFDFETGKYVESNISKTDNRSVFGYGRINWQATEKAHHLLTLSNLQTIQETVDTGVKSNKLQGMRSRLHHLTNYRFNEQNLLQLAYEFDEDRFQKKNLSKSHIHQNHFVGAYEWNPIKMIILGAGLRHTYHQIYKNHSTYQLSGKVFLGKTEFFSSFGTGFRSPSLFELKGSDDPLFTVYANPTLLPEKSQSFEGGVENLIEPLKTTIRLTYFTTQIDKIISYDRDTKRYINIHKRRTHGLETLLKTDFTQTASGQITYTYTRWLDSNTKRHPLKIPQHKLGLSFSWHPNKWETFIEGVFISKIKDYGNVPVGAYFVARLGGAYKVNSHFKIFARVENIFDRTYEQTAGYATRGRGIYGGISVKF